MKVILISIVFSLFCSTYSFAEESPEAAIGDYIKKIDQKYKAIAKSLVMMSYARIFANQLPSDSKVPDFSSISDDIFTIVFSNKIQQEKIDSLTQTFVKINLIKRKWLSKGSKLKTSSLMFNNFFTDNANICSEKNFQDSLALINTNTPSGIDLSNLTRAFEVGFTVTLSEDGSLQNADIFSQFEVSKNENEYKEAISFGVGAGVSLIAKSAKLGPYVAVGVAVAILIKLSWDLVELQEHNKKLRALAILHKELFNKLTFEKTVRDYYYLFCKKVSSAYTDNLPLVQEILEAKAQPQQIQEKIAIHSAYLAQRKIIEQADNIDFLDRPSDFYHFFSWRLLQSVVASKQQSGVYDTTWSNVMQEYSLLEQSIQDAMTKIIESKKQQDINFRQVMIDLFDFANFKRQFTKLLLKQRQAVNVEDQVRYLEELENLLAYFQMGKKSLTVSQLEFLKGYKKIVEQIRQEQQ
ncbi:MAG: hypothetical protein ISR65_08895 [Bacteriovoracaceae bacterium]|nr:hypothetical protein [Bacteriovoracaceae bacterium]